MEHDPTPSPERDQELPKDVFDLKKLDPEQVAALIAALGVADDVPGPDTPQIRKARQVMAILSNDLESFPHRAPERTDSLFSTLVESDDPWVRAIAVGHLALPFLKELHEAQDYEARQGVIDWWLKLLDDEVDYVRDCAVDRLSELVCQTGWLDEPTLQFLDSKLPSGRKRDDP